ncbi:hypothetical protein HHI36_017589, partial [Cryptolaemus montrouzieri]
MEVLHEITNLVLSPPEEDKYTAIRTRAPFRLPGSENKDTSFRDRTGREETITTTTRN